MRLPGKNTEQFRLASMLPADNKKLVGNSVTHSCAIACTMWYLIKRGLVKNVNPGNGRKARYELTRIGQDWIRNS